MTDHPVGKSRHILGYIGLVRDEMRMQNWDIILHREPEEEEDVLASSKSIENHTTHNIWLSPGFFDLTPRKIRDTVVHELVHAQHRDLDQLHRNCTYERTEISEDLANAWDADRTVFMERFVSWITQQIAHRIPVYDPSRSYSPRVGCYLIGEESG